MLNNRNIKELSTVESRPQTPKTYAQLKAMYDKIRRTKQYSLLSKVHSLMPKSVQYVDVPPPSKYFQLKSPSMKQNKFTRPAILEQRRLMGK